MYTKAIGGVGKVRSASRTDIHPPKENNMDNQKIGRYIADKRKNKSLTQAELAARLGVTDKAVSKWERGVSHS